MRVTPPQTGGTLILCEVFHGIYRQGEARAEYKQKLLSISREYKYKQDLRTNKRRLIKNFLS